MIRLYLVRHGIAVDPADFNELDDGARPLTPKGRRRFRRVARAFHKLGEPVDFIFSSPLVRAVQTAELLARALKHDDVQIVGELKPEVGVATLLAAVARRVKDGEAAALVGHDPQISHLAVTLGGLSREEASRLEFRKGAIVRIDAGDLPRAKPAQARFWIRPKTCERIEGLPLRLKS